MAVAVIAHEFGHLEDANANPARYKLVQEYSDSRNAIKSKYGNAGLIKGIAAEELAEKQNAKFQAFGVKNAREWDNVVDNTAERLAIPVIQQRFANIRKEIPESVQDAIARLQGGK